jgi:PAS domain-containing protein
MTEQRLQAIIDGAEHGDDCVIVFDPEDRVVYANAPMRKQYSFIDFDKPQTYDSIFWACYEAGTFYEPDVYHDPEEFLRQAKEVRRASQTQRWLRQRADGRWFVIRQMLLPDGHQVQVRIDASHAPDLTVQSGVEDKSAGTDPLSTPLRRAFDFHPIAIAIVRANAMIWHWNRRFADVLDQGGLSLDGPHLAAPDGETNSWLRRAIHRYAHLHEEGSVATRLVDRPHMGDRLLISVRPTAATQFKTPGHEPAAFVTATPLREEPAHDMGSWLRLIYGLTQAEAKQVVALTEGQPATDADGALLERLGVTGTAGLTRLVSRLQDTLCPEG